MKNTIIYKPHCSDCGELLHGAVTYGRSLQNIYLNSVHPYRCPNCGTFFETIVTPDYTSKDSFEYDADEIGGKMTYRGDYG